ncbi:hypothetical protein PIB30_079480, partial [Stylosanthes scabra]|nr:hypothetical protein [Stylosanthes scabra]
MTDSAELEKKIAEKGVSAEKIKESVEEEKGIAELRFWVVVMSGERLGVLGLVWEWTLRHGLNRVIGGGCVIQGWI